MFHQPKIIANPSREIIGVCRSKARFKPRCLVACRFRVLCTVYLSHVQPRVHVYARRCNATSLRTAGGCKRRNLSQRMHISPDFSPKEFPGLAACVNYARQEAALPLWKRADLLDNRSHTCISSCIDMRKSLTLGTSIHDPESVRCHMMARTRSSHQTLKKRLLKHATPWKIKSTAMRQNLIGQFMPLETWEFQQSQCLSCWDQGFRCLAGRHQQRMLVVTSFAAIFCVVASYRQIATLPSTNLFIREDLTTMIIRSPAWRVLCCNPMGRMLQQGSAKAFPDDQRERVTHQKTRVPHWYSTS